MDEILFDISIIIPTYNEEQSIKLLYEQIVRVLDTLDKNYEVIFIDDGSTDSTFKEIYKLHCLNNKVKCIHLRKNFGKSLALDIGFNEALGDIVITMDADLQDDPEEIRKFINKINEGWDVVSGWKKMRKDPLEKRLASELFNTVVAKASGLRLHDFNCGFKAYRRNVLKTIELYGGLHRFIPVIAYSYGFKICEIPVKHHKRRFGETKFGKERYLAGLLDFFTTIFITGYLRKPLHFLGRISLFVFMMGSFLLIYVAIMKFGFGQTGNRPSLTISIFLLSFSAQIFLFGLVADLLAYTNQKHNFKRKDFISKKLP
ncbi:MAG: glycosyltransferase family 2 protein [Candidatus Omnitrophica bacterium]|nr:glycosyltransferase family 2 protein [Candidatus Omnitrophota bacterium]